MRIYLHKARKSAMQSIKKPSLLIRVNCFSLTLCACVHNNIICKDRKVQHKHLKT